MAWWAMAMVAATIVSIAFTAAGIWLIWLNLREARRVTREAIRSADAANLAVEEAKRTTAAAEAGVAETRRIGEAQTRAYIALEQVSIVASSMLHCFQINFSIRNLGNSPAQEFNYCFLIRVFRLPTLAQQVPPYERENVAQLPYFPRNGDRRIRQDGVERISHAATDFIFTEEERTFLADGTLWVEISIATRFRDVFGNEIVDMEHFQRLGGIPLDQEVPLPYWAYAAHSQVPVWEAAYPND